MRIKNKPMSLSKTIEDSHGKIVVKVCDGLEGALKIEGMDIAEMVTQGCVIGFWEARLMDGVQWVAEFREVHDRLTDVEMEPERVYEALCWGRKIVDTIVDFYFN